MEGEDKASARSKINGPTELFVNKTLFPVRFGLFSSNEFGIRSHEQTEFVYLCILLVYSAPNVSVNMVRQQVHAAINIPVTTLRNGGSISYFVALNVTDVFRSGPHPLRTPGSVTPPVVTHVHRQRCDGVTG